MLQHRVCPRCGAENLADEPVCFACGAPWRRRAAREGPPQTPWILYLGVLAGLSVFAAGAFYAARALAAYRQQAGLPASGMLLLAVAVALFGQYGFLHARRQDRSLWEYKRAPQLPLKGVGPGDDVWLRGTIACKTPLAVPYMLDQQCVYYEVIVRERDEGRQRWRVTQHERQVLDFSLEEGEGSVYVPSGGLSVDAPICLDNLIDSDLYVKVWALFVGWQVSVCGRISDGGPHRRLDQLSEQVPALVSYQNPADYLAGVSRSERLHRAAGWALSIVAAVVLLATYVSG